MKAFVLLWIISAMPVPTGTHIGRKIKPHMGVQGPYSTEKGCAAESKKLRGEAVLKLGPHPDMAMVCVQMKGYPDWLYQDMQDAKRK